MHKHICTARSPADTSNTVPSAIEHTPPNTPCMHRPMASTCYRMYIAQSFKSIAHTPVGTSSVQRTRTTNSSNRHRTSIVQASNGHRKGIVRASNRHRTGIEQASNRLRTGIEQASYRHRTGIEQASYRHRTGISCAPHGGNHNGKARIYLSDEGT